MKKTIYELLGMVKDGKVPEKIKYNNKIYYAKGNATEGFVEYFSDEDEWGFNHYVRYENLNKEVEILEEPKGMPEKLITWYSVEEIQSLGENCEFANCNFETMYDKINEIIDTLEMLNDKIK